MFDQLYARWFGQRKPRRNHTRTQPLLRMPVNLTLERLEQREVLSNTQFPIGYFSLSPVVGAPGQTVAVTESVTLNAQPISASITGATWSGGNATFTTSGSSGYQAGYRVIVSGVAPYGYDGIYNITSTSNNTFVVPLANDPGTFTTAGTSSVGLVPNNSAAGVSTITSASWSSSNGGAATFTTSAALSTSYVTGASVTISALTGAAAAYNGTYAITSTGANTFTVPLEATSLASASSLDGSAELNSVGYDFTAFQSLIGFDPTVVQVVGTPDTTAFDNKGNTLTNTSATTVGDTFEALDPNTTLSSQTANGTSNTYGEVTLLQGVSNSEVAFIPNGTYSIATFYVTINPSAALGTVSPLKVLATSNDISQADVSAISGVDQYNSATQEGLSFASGFAPVNPTSIAVPNSVAGVDSTLTVLPHAAAVPYDKLPTAASLATSLGGGVLYNPANVAGLESANPNSISFTGNNTITVTDADYNDGIGAVTALTTVVSVSGSPLAGSTAVVGTLTATASGAAIVTGSGASLTITGSPTDITNTLSSLVYTPGAGYFGTTTLTVSTDSNGTGGTQGFNGVFDVASTDTRTVQIQVVGLFISAVNTDATSASQFLQVLSTVDSYTIPSTVYLAGVYGGSGFTYVSSGSTITATAGTVTDVFTLGGFTTGQNGYLTLLEAGSAYVASGDSSGAGTVETNSAASAQGFGNAGTTSEYSLGGTGGTGTNVHVSFNKPSGQKTTDILQGAESFLLLSASPLDLPDPGIDIDVSGSNGDAPNGVAGGSPYNSWNVEDSVGIGGAGTFSYGALTFGTGGTTLSGSTTVATPGYTVNYVARVASDTGYTSSSWVGSTLTGPESTSYALSSSNSTSFASSLVPKVGAANNFAPQETVEIEDGSSNGAPNQHSQVTELTVVFSSPVNISSLSGAYSLVDSSGNNIPITVTGFTNTSDTGNVADNDETGVVITFNSGSPDVFALNNPFTDAHSFISSTALYDGNYFLDTNVSDIVSTSSPTVHLDGAKNGVAGSTTTGTGNLNGDGANEVDEFWRLFGDVQGTRTVDALDTYDFLQAQASRSAVLSATVTAAAFSNGTATLTLQESSSTHNRVAVGESVTIANVLLNGATSAYDGTFIITAFTGTATNATSISFALATTPATGTYTYVGATAKNGTTYQFYFDVNGNNAIDVGDTTSQTAFFANAFGSTTFAGIGNYGTKTLAP